MSQDPQTKAPEKQWIGEPLNRVDGRLKVTGRAKYAGEFSFPDLAHGILVQSTIARGKVTNIDSSIAEKMPGVLAVITHQSMQPAARPTVPPAGQSVPFFSPDIVFSGQNVAVVVAETLEEAQAAADAVRVTYAEEKPAVELVPNLGAAFVPGSTGRQPVSKRGDVDIGKSQGSIQVDQTYRTPTEHHNPMEPHATVATWTDDQHILVYDATQGVTGAAHTIASAMELPAENVHLIDPFVGGGFGCKGQSWPHSSIAALASKAVKRPVKIELTRKQMWTSNGHRPETNQALQLAAGTDAKLTAIHAEMANATSRLESFLEPTGLDSAITYSCSNVLVRHQLVRLDLPAPTYMRAPGESSGSFSIESAMDELAIALKLDPIELRLKNYAETDETQGRPFSSKSLRECYSQGAEQFGWSKRTPGVGSMRQGKLLVGYGMATATYPANFRGASARATMYPDGHVLIQCGTQDLGTGTYTILGQIAADALGISPSHIQVQIADTKLPGAPGSGGSTSAASAGSAVFVTARQLRNTVITTATSRVDTPLHNLGPEDVTVEDGLVRSKRDPSKSMSYAQIVKATGQKTIEETGSAQPGLERGPRNGHSLPDAPKGYTMQSFGAQFCEVHVDEDLRTVRLARWVGAFAIGNALNRKTLTSQLYGGIVFGIGMALLEESLLDPRFGRFVNSNLAEYHLPVHKDIPDMSVIIVPEKDTLVNPIGVKGAGEIGITGVAAAIANAIYHATGKRVRDLPITLDKII